MQTQLLTNGKYPPRLEAQRREAELTLADLTEKAKRFIQARPATALLASVCLGLLVARLLDRR